MIFMLILLEGSKILVGFIIRASKEDPLLLSNRYGAFQLDAAVWGTLATQNFDSNNMRDGSRQGKFLKLLRIEMENYSNWYRQWECIESNLHGYGSI